MNLESMARALMAKRHHLNVAAALGAAGWPEVEEGTSFSDGVIGRSGHYGILVCGSVLDMWTEIEEGAEGAFQIFDGNREIATWTRSVVGPERAKELVGKYGESFYKSDQMLEMVPEYEEDGA